MNQVTWDGSLANGETVTINITAAVVGAGSSSDLTQLAMIIDGSGSISTYPQGNVNYPGEWELMLEGIASAIEDSNVFPHDGTVELTVIQFATSARVEIYPVVVTAANYLTVANNIRAIPKTGLGTLTNMEDGINLTANTVYASANFSTYERKIINLVTDGVPTAGGSATVTLSLIHI